MKGDRNVFKNFIVENDELFKDFELPDEEDIVLDEFVKFINDWMDETKASMEKRRKIQKLLDGLMGLIVAGWAGLLGVVILGTLINRTRQ